MTNAVLITLTVFLLGALLIYYVFSRGRNKLNLITNEIDKQEVERILMKSVVMYQQLGDEQRKEFVSRVIYFLNTTKISAEKGAVITMEDKVLVAASATIPLFHFQNWAYENLNEVLIYPDYFDEEFDTHAEDKNVAGMVGDGSLNHKMILSLKALRGGFSAGSTGNTAIHEFVHLIDKADGEVDGIPEYIIPKVLVHPWLNEMSKTIREIRQGKSDIRDYAATNDAEFLAVLSEYFFKKPKMLKEDHPELYEMLDVIYNRAVPDQENIKA